MCFHIFDNLTVNEINNFDITFFVILEFFSQVFYNYIK